MIRLMERVGQPPLVLYICLVKRLIVPLLFLTLVGCTTDKATPVATPDVTAVNRPDEPAQPPPRLAALAQQNMCSEQAKKKFHEDNSPNASGTEYTSHYDPRTNVCYIRVHRFRMEGGIPSVSDAVYDAFEGRGYASYIWVNAQGKKYWEVEPMECEVQPIGRGKVFCKSSDEFDTLVDTYFGIGR